MSPSVFLGVENMNIVKNPLDEVQTHTAEIGDYNVTVVIRPGEPEPPWSRKKPRKARLYVNAPDAWLPSSDHLKFTIKGEDPEMDKAWRRYNKAEVHAKREAIGYARAAFMVKAENDPLHCTDNAFHTADLGSANWKFSWKAGCSCRCSPGFVAKNYELAGCDIWITVEFK